MCCKLEQHIRLFYAHTPFPMAPRSRFLRISGLPTSQSCSSERTSFAALWIVSRIFREISSVKQAECVTAFSSFTGFGATRRLVLSIHICTWKSRANASLTRSVHANTFTLSRKLRVLDRSKRIIKTLRFLSTHPKTTRFFRISLHSIVEWIFGTRVLSTQP